MVHDFVNFPELTNSQMQIYYFASPHRQITEDLCVEVIKVHDGDTITARWYSRNFDFPIRFSNIAAPELDEEGGKESQSWLEEKILGKEVQVRIDPNNRVEKWGRLLGRIELDGMDVGDESIILTHSVRWKERNDMKLPTLKVNT